MDCSSIRFSRHALERMFERAIGVSVVAGILRDGECIEDYPHDRPFPSRLIFGGQSGRPVHVVVARDPTTEICVVITVYCPDAANWGNDFKTRSKL